MPLSKALTKRLIIQQTIIPALINLVLNGLISWQVLKNVESITFWGKPSIAIDILLTAFLIPFITCFINSYSIAKGVQSGKIEQLDTSINYLTNRYVKPIYLRSILLGVVALICVGLPTILLLETTWAEPISLWQFVTFKALWAAVLAALFTPLIAFVVIQNESYALQK